jgi:hypothetical protein
MSMNEDAVRLTAAYDRSIQRHRHEALDKIRALTKVPYEEKIDSEKIRLIFDEMDRRVAQTRKLYQEQLDEFK